MLITYTIHITANINLHKIFIDINNTLDCYVDNESKVVAMSLNNGSNRLTTVAGGDHLGIEPTLLCLPLGILVIQNRIGK
jgi:hypothetical protein